MQVINNIWSISRPRHDVLFMWRRIRVHGVIAFVSRWEESSWITLSDTHSPIQTAVSVGETRHAPTQQCTLWRRFGLVWGSVWNFFCFLPWDYTRKNVFFYVGDKGLNKLLFVMQTERKQLHKYSRINVSLFVLRCTYIILIICSLFVSKKWLKYLYFNF